MIYTNQSIAGVTYMDHFDFEDRYKNVNECNPFYWHPLHLPEQCAEMYEKILRSKIATSFPMRILKKQEHYIFSNENLSGEDISSSSQATGISHEFYTKSLSPHEKMLDYLQRDVMKNPKAPVMGFLPNFGPVTIYRQPVSRKSVNMIKKIAKAHEYDRQKVFEETESYYGRIDVKTPIKSGDSSEINLSHNIKQNDRMWRLKKKTKDGGSLTIKKYVQ